MRLLKYTKVIVFSSFILTGFSPYAQTILKKPVTVCELRKGASPIKLDRWAQDGDTSYMFVFRDETFEMLIQVKSVPLDKSGLSTFARSLSMAKDLSVGDNVVAEPFRITKEKGMLSGSFFSIYIGSARCSITDKQREKLLSVIQTL